MLKITELVLVATLAIYSLLSAAKWKKLTTVKKIFTILSAVVLILVAYNGINSYFIQKQNQSKEEYIRKVEAKYGEIVSGNKSEIPSVWLGNPIFFVELKSNKNKYATVTINHDELIKVYIENGILQVNAIIRDAETEVIAVISENTWKIFDDNYEYNNDECAFELVTKGDRSVVMHIQFEKGRVFMEGHFSSEKESAFIYPAPNAVVDGKPIGDQVLMLLQDSAEPYSEEYRKSVKDHLKKNLIKPIFKYPREKYLGVRAPIFNSYEKQISPIHIRKKTNDSNR
jgi:hypothetical protein